MRINSINYNNNNTSQKQSFGAVKEINEGVAKKLLGAGRERAFDALSEIKNLDVWFFDKIPVRENDGKLNLANGHYILVKDDRHTVKEFIWQSREQNTTIVEKLEEVLLWFQPDKNKKAAYSIAEKINSINQYNTELLSNKARQLNNSIEAIKAKIESTDASQEKKLEKLNGELVQAKGKLWATAKKFQDEKEQGSEGLKFAEEHHLDKKLLITMESSKTTPWENKIKNIDIIA